jgi:ribonucleotide monophosphatase NagD (HAD superfamily)
MIGDQLETDIAGANNFGIDSAVVTGGINRFNSIDDLSSLPPAIRPTYLLRSIKWS